RRNIQRHLRRDRSEAISVKSYIISECADLPVYAAMSVRDTHHPRTCVGTSAHLHLTAVHPVSPSLPSSARFATTKLLFAGEWYARSVICAGHPQRPPGDY